MMLNSFDTSVLRDSGTHSQVNHLVKLQYGLAASERAGQKLCARGLSYRRIAELVSVRYGMVTQWLASLAGTTGRPVELSPAFHSSLAPRVESQPAALPSDATRISPSEDPLLKGHSARQRLPDEGLRREARLLTTLTSECSSLRFQMERLDAEVAALPVALVVLSRTDNCAKLRAESEASPPGRGFWRWRAKK